MKLLTDSKDHEWDYGNGSIQQSLHVQVLHVQHARKSNILITQFGWEPEAFQAEFSMFAQNKLYFTVKEHVNVQYHNESEHN